MDLLVVLGALGFVSIMPVFVLVPFNDEWLRMNYLATHSVLEWTVYHAETWVVRPTAEVILGIAALPTTRPALAHDFNAAAFLGRFHLVYVGLIAAYGCMLYANAAIVARSLRSAAAVTLVLLAVLVSWLVSEELAYSFYWADGYANILMPFTLVTSGLPLLFYPGAAARLVGALLMLLGALGHEVTCIYTVGVTGLALATRTPSSRPWLQRAILAGLLVTSLIVLREQLFGVGPTIRNDVYFRSTGKRYDFAGAWLNIQQIDPANATACVAIPWAAMAIYRDRLNGTVQRMLDDVRRHRMFWVLLALGTFATCFLPLGGVGLKKARLAVGYYSAFTHLWFILFGVVLYPFVDPWLRGAFAFYRRWMGSILPVLGLVAATSTNVSDLRDVVARYDVLRREAEVYMERLFRAPKRVRLCRPRHVYEKPGRKLTNRNQEEYFGIQRVLNRCRGS